MTKAGAIHCLDAHVCWILCNLSQEQIDEGVNSQYDEDSGLRLITLDAREFEVEEVVLP